MSKSLRTQFVRKKAHENLIDFSLAVHEGYMANWHLEIIAQKLEKALECVLRGESKKIMIFVPPRNGKSQLASVNFPAWALGKYPELPIIVSSYSGGLASDFGLATRDLMNNPVYQKIFSTRLRADAEAKSKWLTKAGGGYTATGVGGSITGKGFSLGIIDDPIKSRKEAESKTIRDTLWDWYRAVFYTRQDGAGAIILIQTRWHEDDLAGRLLKTQRDQWEVIRFPAIATSKEEYRDIGDPLWPKRFSKEFLMERKETLGPYNWSALFQQRPVSSESQIFEESMFQSISWGEVERKETRNYLTLDPAPAKTADSDWIGVCENYVDKDNNWHLKGYHIKDDADALINLLFKLKKDMNFEVAGIEQGTYRDVLKPFLNAEMRKRNIFFDIEELKHRRTRKELRIKGLLPRYKSGSIYHIEGECGTLEEELLVFPSGMNDDVADATAYQSQIAEKPYPQEGEDQEDFGLYSQSYS